MVKNVSTTASPSGPLSGASVNQTRAAYVPPSRNLRWCSTSDCRVPAPVPSVDDVSCKALFEPDTAGNDTFSLGQVAPGMPGGPPALVRMVQWCAAMAASFAFA